MAGPGLVVWLLSNAGIFVLPIADFDVIRHILQFALTGLECMGECGLLRILRDFHYFVLEIADFGQFFALSNSNRKAT